MAREDQAPERGRQAFQPRQVFFARDNWLLDQDRKGLFERYGEVCDVGSRGSGNDNGVNLKLCENLFEAAEVPGPVQQRALSRSSLIAVCDCNQFELGKGCQHGYVPPAEVAGTNHCNPD